MSHINILAITGSLRKDSFNRMVAGEAAKILKGRAHVEILDWEDVPFMNEDIEFPAPEAVKRVRGKVEAADGVWFFTPEYNHAVPGVLKNLLDWLSRPVSETQHQVLLRKPATIAGVGAGPFGAILALEQLSGLINFLDMDVMNQPRTAIANAYDLLKPDGTLELGASAPFLKDQADAFLAYLKARA